jgi:type II secretory ATPase GspE/PulE/Tfp pilus assembly ATPase PilB-like protein
MLGGSLSAVLAHRLARRLCPHCKEPYQPNNEFLKKAGLSSDKVKEFFRPPTNPEETCTHCGGLGYRGRVGVFELLNINERMRDMIRDKAAMSAIKAEARKDGMLYMKEEGLRLVVRGVTSVDELLRVVK